MKIYLVCYAGMSTSLLLTRMEKVAEERNLDVEIQAIAATQIHEVLEDADVILLGPQARYLLKDIQEIADKKGIPVDVIDSITYGTMNGAKVLDMALNLVKNN
ncbi:MAG: PTS sugar transporter subunit IIB [Tepidanaerobacter acetatoxydans]|uniref:PTS sugar transporter subunit IIB n=1 Tax=Tepidanaerobacter acetatoxydans TaxID=499229 RepID=UPI0026F0798A|nr:PTS sugar transporter subunit IIB [Tepidanaerobacter acetatoxydans]NLU11580.1 PTS sugar transporter subunit IIB [Tepidanaerobacter acetatoxydans]